MAESDDTEAPGPVAGLSRAAAGALIFGLPMLMTMELWELGASIQAGRLAALLIVWIPLLVGVAHRLGFEQTFGWREDLRDVGFALGIGVVVSAALLALFGLIEPGLSTRDAVGMVGIQTLMTALGALLGRSQLNSERQGDEMALEGYFGAMFLMVVGALFLSLNLAPTEEMILISFVMTPFHGLALVFMTLGVMSGFNYAVASREGGPARLRAGLADFLRFTVAGYAVCLCISAAALWVFGQIDGLAPERILMATVVLAFPASVGAAAARLIL